MGIFSILTDKRSSKKASTLIEGMIAILIMMMVVIGGGAFVYHSYARIQLERNRRVAIEAANRRLEELHASSYDEIRPLPADDWDEHSIIMSGSNEWELDSGVDETVDINGITLPIDTTVQYIDLEGDVPANSRDYLKVTVSVGYRLNPDERVELVTYIGPYT